jgi:hypothetical protein
MSAVRQICDFGRNDLRGSHSKWAYCIYKICGSRVQVNGCNDKIQFEWADLLAQDCYQAGRRDRDKQGSLSDLTG